MTAARVPRIETERLLLREHRRADLDACAAMWADPAIVRYISRWTESRRETWWRLLCYRGLWALLGFGYWAIEEKATRSFVGEVGFGDFARGLEPSLDGVPELGWVIASAAQGRGLGSEAVLAATAWADDVLRCRTACLIDPDNEPSCRIARKAGFREHAPIAVGAPSQILWYRTPGVTFAPAAVS